MIFAAICSSTASAPSGVGYGRVGVTPAAGGEGALLRSVWQSFAELRALIEGRILAAIPDRDIAGVAVAFVTGSQSAVPKDVLQAMRDSGLAHLLSVSGLHVGLVAGILFFLSRAMLALVPPIALRYPIKKWAAGLALAGAVFYTLLSGRQRAGGARLPDGGRRALRHYL